MKTSRRTLAFLGLALLGVAATTAEAGPYLDGRLLLHINPELVYSVGQDPRGRSGIPDCESVVNSIGISEDPVAMFVIAAFPRPTAPRLGWVSFGIDYDPDHFVVVDNRFPSDDVVIEGPWPDPGAGIRLDWDRDPPGSSIEIGWFAGYVTTDGPTEFRLVPGPLGGYFGDFISHEVIDGFGSLGFGMESSLECAARETCCSPDGSCTLETPVWCKWYEGVSGPGRDCDFCDEVGACCTPRRWCEITLEEDCTEERLTWLGGGTVCDPNECFPLGSCCFTDGECLELRENLCLSRSGWFTLDGTCEDQPCTDLGACCHYRELEACQLTTEAACLEVGSTYDGDGSTCRPDLCTSGVCCGEFPHGCIYSTAEECQELDGEFSAGAWGPVPEACSHICVHPVEQTSWGRVKKLFRDRGN